MKRTIVSSMLLLRVSDTLRFSSRWITHGFFFAICALTLTFQLVTLSASAQYIKLFDFDRDVNGQYPRGSLLFEGTFLYGMTTSGGTTTHGIIFKIKTDGTGYVKLHDFESGNEGHPQGSLISDGTFLYGMTMGSEITDFGTVFKIMPDGSGYEVILNFNGANGKEPHGSLLYDGIFLYGMTYQGGLDGSGTIFKILPDGTGYVNLHDFAGAANGSHPYGSLIFEGGFLYGMTASSGDNDLGTIFKILPDGSGFNKLFDFDNITGTRPGGDLVSDGTFLYGMTSQGGANNDGTVFKIMPDGTGFLKLQDFDTNVIGGAPFGSLIFEGGLLYGMTSGDEDISSVFKIMPDGTGFVNLLEFSDEPHGSLISDGTFLYGMTFFGGGNSDGTVFKYSIAPAAITITTQPTPADVCNGFIATMAAAASGTTNITYQWQSASEFSGSFTDITDGGGYSNTTTSTLSVNTTGLFGEGYYRCKVNGDAAPTAFTDPAFLSVGFTPAPTTTNGIACPPASVTVTASGGTNGQYRWYTSASGGTAIAGEVNSSFTTPLISTTTDYYVAIHNGTCESERTPATAQVNSIPSPPSTIGSAGCVPSFVTLMATGGVDGQYRWYTGETGGTAIAGEVNSSYVTPVLNASATFYVAIDDGTCESVRTAVLADVTICAVNLPPSITPSSLTIDIEGKVTLDLTALITDPDNNLDLSTLKIIQLPESKATVFIDSDNNLVVDYTGILFAGQDHLIIEVCDLQGSCVQQQITITVEGDIIVYNGISPNGDGKNDSWIIRNISQIDETMSNRVMVFNRWGDAVFEVSNYDNVSRVFTGFSKNGGELPSGTYFYKIEFASGRKSQTGYISLKR